MDHFFVARDKDFKLTDHLWDGYTLVLPCISVGNVPQLTLDLLISSLVKSQKDSAEKDLELVGYIRSKNVHPFAGPDPFTSHGTLLTTSIQGLVYFISKCFRFLHHLFILVFVSKAKKLVLIQQRSPIYKVRSSNIYKKCIFNNFLYSRNFEMNSTPSFPSGFPNIDSPSFCCCRHRSISI